MTIGPILNFVGIWHYVTLRTHIIRLVY